MKMFSISCSASGAQQGHKSGDKTSSSKLRPHKCDTCSKGFPNKTKLRAHRITHIPKNEREKPFECPVCSKRFSLQSALQKHRKIVHKETRDPSSKCHLCERNFLLKSQLRYHLISAHNFNHTQATAKAYIQTNKTKKELPIVPALHGAEDSESGDY
jgi:transcription elongation factor Elf1